MRVVAIAIAIAVAAAAATGCDAYAPELDNAPFLCGRGEQRCPEGYTCIAQDAGPEVCQKGTGGPSCTDDTAREPNDTLTTAATAGRAFDAIGSVCPANDRDTYAVELRANDGIEVVVDATPGGNVLDASILNAGGVPIARAARGTNQLRAAATAQTAGTYYVQVFGGADGAVNNYALAIRVTP